MPTAFVETDFFKDVFIALMVTTVDSVPCQSPHTVTALGSA